MYTSTPTTPVGLRCGCHWGRGSQDYPSEAGSESVFCCTAVILIPKWRQTLVSGNCRGGGAPEVGWALGPEGAPSCPPPGPWCTHADWRSRGPEKQRIHKRRRKQDLNERFWGVDRNTNRQRCITSAFQSSSVAVPSNGLNSRAAPFSSRDRRCSGVRQGDANRPQSSDVKSEKSKAREWRFDKRSSSDGVMRGPE